MQVIRKVIDIHSQLAYIKTMIHCVCNNINSQAVDNAHSDGARTPLQVQRACGHAFNCGACKVSLQERLDMLQVQKACAFEAAE